MHSCRRTSKLGNSDDNEKTGVGGKEENGGRETQILLHLLKKQKVADYPTNENNISVSLCQGVDFATTRKD